MVTVSARPIDRARRIGQGLLAWARRAMSEAVTAPSTQSSAEATRRRARERARRLAPYAPLVLVTAYVAVNAVRAVLARVGQPAAALDDTYIHFQYARAIAEGHPFRFQPGEPISTGATSFLWPALLAVPYAVGLRGDAIMWAAWALSFTALGALAYEAYVLARPLVGRGAALGAAAMTLAFGGFTWGAASGMEVVPFAWTFAACIRRACEWAESPSERTPRALRFLIALAFASPLLRPEGSIAALVAGVAVAAFPLRERAPTKLAWRARARASLFVLAAAAPTLLLVVLTGRATSSTAQVKLLVGNPYYPTAETALLHVRLLVSSILDGDVWSAEFLPRGGAPFACAGLAAVLWRGHATRRLFRAAAVLVLALSLFVPCLYLTFLWNRLRYLWPFATGWFVALACLAHAVGVLVARLHARGGALAPTLVAGSFAGMLAVRLDGVVEDVAQSASGIHRQQVALGKWADANLPRDARIGVNDTGAIAYFGNRKTFDVVGLTTPSEGKYWIAGAGARLEHYERMHATMPTALPTHFIVYPEWMACDAVLGRALHEEVVTDATILGGQIMRAYEARWDLLGTGERPWTALRAVHDAVDVADLESEAAHDYELLGARDADCTAEEGNAPDGAIVVDGGRGRRVRDRFRVDVPASASAIVARVRADRDVVLDLRADGTLVGSEPVVAGAWSEVRFRLPAERAGARVAFEVNARGSAFTSFHYWVGE